MRPLPANAWMLVVLLGGCAHGTTGGAAAPVRTLPDEVARCTAEAERRDPALEIHTTGAHVTRGGVVIGLAVEIPEDPLLQQCLNDLPSLGVRFPASDVPAPEDSLGLGGFAVDVGPTRAGPRDPDEFGTSLALHRARTRSLVVDLVERGLLSGDDATVREILASSPQPR